MSFAGNTRAYFCATYSGTALKQQYLAPDSAVFATDVSSAPAVSLPAFLNPLNGAHKYEGNVIPTQAMTWILNIGIVLRAWH